MELNSFIFPAPSPSYTVISFPGELLKIPRLKGKRQGIPCIFLPFSRGSSKILLYFHGNAEDLGQAYEMLNHTRNTLMVHVLALEYPGYGIYKGKPSASRILEDSENVFNYLTNVLKISPTNIFIFGRSIGAGPAVWLGAEKNPGALLLMSAYTSIRAVAKNIAGSLLMYFVKERFRNIDLMPKVKCPCFLVHGQNDTLIPYQHSQILHELCGGPSNLLLPSKMDHNGFDFFEDLTLPFTAFLIHCGISTVPESLQNAFISFPDELFYSKIS
mmetsp:Transcript_267/g.279  ORF Transcript_267/g.279 Transcript_267/m.279 type:complete len:272 (+) Transcript_267:22-837(+)